MGPEVSLNWYLLIHLCLVQPTLAAPTSQNLQPMSAEQTKLVAKLHTIRVKLLRLSRRLGQGPRNTVVAQVRQHPPALIPPLPLRPPSRASSPHVCLAPAPPTAARHGGSH